MALLVLIDTFLGFYLDALLPGMLLTLAASCFIIAGLKNGTNVGA